MNPQWTLARGYQARTKDTVPFLPYTGGHGELQLLVDDYYWKQLGEPATLTIEIVTPDLRSHEPPRNSGEGTAVNGPMPLGEKPDASTSDLS